MDAGAHPSHRSVEAVFLDFKGRRTGIIKALTSEVDEFFEQCDPEKENLCLYGFPSEQWEVNLPVDEVPPETPEPVLGINFARDGMSEKDWLALVAAHSDSWLLATAFYFGARFGFDKTDRRRLFNMINDLPTIFETVSQFISEQSKKSLSSNGRSNSKSKSGSKGSNPPVRHVKPVKPEEDEDEEGLEDDDDDDDQENTVCGKCNEYYSTDEFWICCDMCETWFHGKCVRITQSKAAQIEQYKCPSCSKKARY